MSSGIVKRACNKLKKEGARGFICSCVNNVVFFLCRLLCINNSLIVLESDGDLCDNAYALYDYMLSHDFLESYKIVWVVHDVETAKKQNKSDSTIFVEKIPHGLAIKRAYYLATCKWYIYDHVNLLEKYREHNGQTIIYLSHGWGYKASKGSETGIKHYDYITATGDLAAKGLSEYWGESIEKAIITGYPRCDYFFHNNSGVNAVVDSALNLSSYKKVLFWMPTFRQSTIKDISEEYLNNCTGLPMFATDDDLQQFSRFLKKNNFLLVFKIHHLQADLPVFKKDFDNIQILKDDDIRKIGLQLYQLIPYADALISDYSSISIDYLLLDRPLIFTLDDYKKYNMSRGLYPKDAINYMPGYHVYNTGELYEAILDIGGNIDKYRLDRDNVKSQYHTYNDGDSSKRILDYFGIKRIDH